MKNKTTTLKVLLLAAFVSAIHIASAQLVGSDAYMKGNYVEIGLDGAGGFEGCSTTSSPPLPGMHFRSNNPLFGFVANPQMDGWVNYDGDFFTPGSPESGWGIEIGSTGMTSKGNNCAIPTDLPGAITAWSHIGSLISCDWEGDDTIGTNLHIKINYQLQDTALFYITTVTITNNTASPISDIYYIRNIDPDNNESISFDYTTTNTIMSQIAAGGSYTGVSAGSAVPWSSFYGLVSIDSNSVAGYGGFANRDASDMYNGIGFTQTVGSSNFADEAIFITHKISTLGAGMSALIPAAPTGFKFASVFSAAAVPAALAALAGHPLTTSVTDIVNTEVSVYPNPFTDNVTFSIGKAVTLSNAEIHIYDVVGKEVKLISNVQSHELTIDRTGLSSGMYVYKLINKGELIGSGKLIIK